MDILLAQWMCSKGDTTTRKVEEMAQLTQEYEVDGIIATELGYNWSTVASSKNFASWSEVDRETRSSTSHNIHDPRTSEHQQDGIGTMLFKKTCNSQNSRLEISGT